MSQNADTQTYSLQKILNILRNQALSMPASSTSSRYLRALESLESSLLRFPSADPGCEAGLSQDSSSANSSLIIDHLSLSLTDWLVSLWLINTPFSTASLYLDIISSLYGSASKAALLPPTKIFSQLKTSLKTVGPEGWKQGINDEIFDRALRLTKNASHLIADDAVAASLVIWSLTHDLQPLNEIALLKKTDSSQQAPLTPQNARQRYLFPLRQSQRTPKQLSTHIAKIVNDLFRRARLPQATDPFQTVEALWAYAALRSGLPASVLISHLGHAPLGLPVLKLSVLSSPLSEGTAGLSQDPVLTPIGNIFLDNPPQWYAMSLRPGVRFTQVCRRIQLLGDRIPDIQLFYPCEEIARAVGKKIVTRQRPFINSVVFFRAKLTDIGRLFSRIGDLAWCYRQSARPGAPYAAISQKQFHLFQQTIAHFTPDYEVAPSGELELKKDDRVQILGGLFAGHEANFDSAAPSGPTNTVYRLNIIGDNGIDWRINIDPRLTQKQ